VSIEEKARELKSKDDGIMQLQKVIDEKSESISLLQGKIDSLQKKGSVNTEELVGKAHARIQELENQVEQLRKEVDAQIAKKDALEARTSGSENKIQELNLKLQDLQKLNDEQKKRIRKTERALRIAEEEMVKAKLEATSKTKELMEAHGAWLPRWFATHLASCQTFISTHWIQYGKPALDVATQKALETKAQAQKWAEPHLETVKSRLVPAVKEHWVAFTTYIEPHVQSLSAKGAELYESSKSTLTPHVIRVQELADPYYQEAKKFTKPYIDQVATVTKPHVDKARNALKPYTKKTVRVYRKFLKSATTYHNQVQATVQETLNKHELTKTFATKELVWFLASALLALPVFFLPKVLSVLFCKKARKPVRTTHTNHTRRRAKRGHPDK
ncbi:Myosin heavy chain-related, partial [Thalictrum thalictroides]